MLSQKSMSIIFSFVFILLTINGLNFASVTNGDSYVARGLHKRSPIILVPGHAGNRLEAKLDKPAVVRPFCYKKTDEYFQIWVKISNMFPGAVDCWIDNVRLIYNSTTRTTKNTPGVSIRVPGFGDTKSVEYLGCEKLRTAPYLNTLVDYLKSMGYQSSQDLHAVPYDFRKSPAELKEYYKDMEELIEDTTKSNSRKATIICHSMGCPLTLYFLNHKDQAWKEKYIEKFIALAGPWAGSYSALKAVMRGDDLSVALFKERIMNQVMKTYPGMHFLLPRPPYWGANDLLVEINGRRYTTANYKELFTAINQTNSYEMWLDIKDLISDLEPPQVETHCIHGYGQKTIEGMISPTEDVKSMDVNYIYGDGDGSVNKRSLKACVKWGKEQTQPFFYKKFRDVNHNSMLHDYTVIEHIADILHL